MEAGTGWKKAAFGGFTTTVEGRETEAATMDVLPADPPERWPMTKSAWDAELDIIEAREETEEVVT